MPEHGPKKISRREVLVIIGSGLALGGIVFARSKFTNREPKNIRGEKQSLDRNTPFVPSIEIGEEIDAQSFKQIVNELFEFANKVDAGRLSNLVEFQDAEQKSWIRSIPFENEDINWGEIYFLSGYISRKNLDPPLLRNQSAREITLNYKNKDQGQPKLVTVNFTDRQEPMRYNPPPTALSPYEMTNFLTDVVESFNRRTNEVPLSPDDPSIEKGYL